MQAQPPRRPPPGIVFDASLDEIDQVLALAMLFGFESQRVVRVPSLSTSRFNLSNAGFLDVVARFFGGERAGDVVVNRIPLPIGMSMAGTRSDQASPMVSAALAKAGPDGRPAYARGVAKLNDTADPVALMRNALSAQTDQNAAVILAGLPVNALSLVALPDGREWVARKARVLTIAGEHVFASEGSFTVTLTVADNRGGSATAVITVEARSVNGQWTPLQNTVPGLDATITQRGSAVSGWSTNQCCTHTFSGEVSHPRAIRLVFRSSGCPTEDRTFVGTVAADPNRIDLTGPNCNVANTTYGFTRK